VQRAAIFENRKFVWVYSKQYGLFELLEAPESRLARFAHALFKLVRAPASATDTVADPGV
jgi:hypothetical protein